MRVHEMTFSPTGGTRRVADLLVEGMGELAGEVARWDLCAGAAARPTAAEVGPDELCLVAVPVYGGRVPAPALARVGALAGCGARAVAVVAYGNRAYEDALLELADALGAAGLPCVAAVAAVAEHSVVRACAPGRPDPEDARLLRSFGERVARACAGGAGAAEGLSSRIPGGRPYVDHGVVPLVPQASSACTRCGLCARRCPVGAIPADDPRSTDGDLCISCMRCVRACPMRARSVGASRLAAVSERLRAAMSERREAELFL